MFKWIKQKKNEKSKVDALKDEQKKLERTIGQLNLRLYIVREMIESSQSKEKL